MEDVDEGFSVGGRGWGESGECLDDMCCARAVCIEEEGWLGVWGCEGGEGEAFLIPFHVCWVVCV